jgi:histidyl-tRNA synthetase
LVKGFKLIFEHEIPKGSRLYFGKSANLKREIENKASTLLLENGYEEIVTPNFSYFQYQSIDDEKRVVRLSDSENKFVTLKADATLDTVRLITNRLGRSTDHKKWFYIQPVFTYPTCEKYQIGVEHINESDIAPALQTLTKIVADFDTSAVLQISNIKIPQIVSQEIGIKLDVIKNSNIEELLKLDIEWLKKLIYVQKVEDIDEILDIVPSSLKDELLTLKTLAKRLEYKNIVLAPLYYSKMKYYESIYFRLFSNNSEIAKGGIYEDDGLISSGFAIYTDNLIEELFRQGLR